MPLGTMTAMVMAPSAGNFRSMIEFFLEAHYSAPAFRARDD
jgi:hypothetical protein